VKVSSAAAVPVGTPSIVPGVSRPSGSPAGWVSWSVYPPAPLGRRLTKA